MLILIVEVLTLRLHYKWHSAPQQHAPANIVFPPILFPLLITASPSQQLVFSHITVKSKCWTERMSTTNYCLPWSRSPRKSTRPPPPPPPRLPPFPPGLSSVRAELHVHVSRQTHQRQTLQRASSVLEVLRYVEQEEALQDKQLVQTILISEHLNSA